MPYLTGLIRDTVRACSGLYGPSVCPPVAVPDLLNVSYSSCTFFVTSTAGWRAGCAALCGTRTGTAGVPTRDGPPDIPK